MSHYFLKSMTPIDNDILSFYAQSSEDSRLKTGLGPLEFYRNKLLITRYLTRQNMDIADVGGGTGHYAAWLSGLGHNVVLIDPVPKHITLAQKRIKKKYGGYTCQLAEARNLPIADHTKDLVILHGPLYHLQHRTDRIRALQEARRIVKPSGVVIGFAISHAASTFAALQAGLIHNDEVFEMCIEELRSGKHHPTTSIIGMMPKAFFHHPISFEEEFTEAGFIINELLAVEGIGWLSGSFFSDWADPKKRERLLELIEFTQADRNLLSLSPHIMLAAKPSLESGSS